MLCGTGGALGGADGPESMVKERERPYAQPEHCTVFLRRFGAGGHFPGHPGCTGGHGLFVQLLAGAVPRRKGQPEHLAAAHAGEKNSDL